MHLKAIEILGVGILSICMLFALVSLETADSWISIWFPFVIAGSALTIGGTIAKQLVSAKNRSNKTVGRGLKASHRFHNQESL